MAQFRIGILGGGIIGAATAREILSLNSQIQITILEKEPTLAFHQTGRNSGVIHSGIYYKPESMRAELCRYGRTLLERFCDEKSIPFNRCGKLIVAYTTEELPRLTTIFERGKANQINCSWLSGEQIAEIEPYAAGIAAVRVPEAGIVDYSAIVVAMAKDIKTLGGEIRLSQEVKDVSLRESMWHVTTNTSEHTFDYVLNCTGLQSDRVAKLFGKKPSAQIIPFRGEYYKLNDQAASLCRGLIYPTPDPRFPFLGVHVCRTVSGEVECGPNAVLALSREGYTWKDISPRDIAELLRFKGFQKFAIKHMTTGLQEIYRSLSRQAFLRSIQRLIPDIQDADIAPAPSAVRAQAMNLKGELLDDFCFEEDEHALHVINAPSPAATASIAIAEKLSEKIYKKIGKRISVQLSVPDLSANSNEEKFTFGNKGPSTLSERY